MIFLKKIQMIEYRVEGLGEKFDYHSHLEYEIYFFHSGICRYLINNQIYDLQAGDILIMDGTALHKPNVNPNTTYVRSVVHFSPELIKGVLQEMGAMYLLDTFKKLNHHLIRPNNNNEIVRLGGFLYRLSTLNWAPELNDIQVETEKKVLLLEILNSVHKLGEVDAIKLPKEKTDKTVHAENIAAFIKTNYMHKITLEWIGRELSLSKSYVSHVFKEMTGFTIMEYVMGCRLTQIKYLLEMEPNKGLKDIALECGFESLSHFSRYFHEKVGVTAGEYRRIRQKIYSGN